MLGDEDKSVKRHVAAVVAKRARGVGGLAAIERSHRDATTNQLPAGGWACCPGLVFAGETPDAAAGRLPHCAIRLLTIRWGFDSLYL